MGNEWVEFVRKFAKDNNITYSRAIKEAGPAYRKIKKGKPTWTGKGLGDLPDETQSDEIGSYLDDKSLFELSKTNQGINKNKGIRRDLENRRNIRPAEAKRLLSEVQQFHREYDNAYFTGRSLEPEYFQRIKSYLEVLKQIRDNPLLDGEQGLVYGANRNPILQVHLQDLAQQHIDKLEGYLSHRKHLLELTTIGDIRNEPRSMRRRRRYL